MRILYRNYFKSKSKVNFKKGKEKQTGKIKGKLLMYAKIRIYYFPVCPCTNIREKCKEICFFLWVSLLCM